MAVGVFCGFDCDIFCYLLVLNVEFEMFVMFDLILLFSLLVCREFVLFVLCCW